MRRLPRPAALADVERPPEADDVTALQVRACREPSQGAERAEGGFNGGPLLAPRRG